MASAYRGRFAPSPTGPLHAGSLVAALASWLDARAHHGTWLVRIEDIDTVRCEAGMGERILAQLAACGMVSDEPVWWQSQRAAAYGTALAQLVSVGLAYPCACSRRAIEVELQVLGQEPERGQTPVYPGTCRPDHGGLDGRTARAWRMDIRPHTELAWNDRRLGAQVQNVEQAVGDFVLKRADGLWAYQLAVVVDDAAQGITDVVRGEDLADNTPRQRVLQTALGLPLLRYLHTPLVLDADGDKLSKNKGAAALVCDTPTQALVALQAAAQALGLPRSGANTVGEALAEWVRAWGAR
ncbi:GlnS Glutamyl- and glutaminyl-tRNA synthetases [Burkholderiaceae bacterium]